jgi:hypothetical protein
MPTEYRAAKFLGSFPSALVLWLCCRRRQFWLCMQQVCHEVFDISGWPKYRLAMCETACCGHPEALHDTSQNMLRSLYAYETETVAQDHTARDLSPEWTVNISMSAVQT